MMVPYCEDCRTSTSATGCPKHSGITFHIEPTRPTHPHDGYAYDGCLCPCCQNIRVLADITERARPYIAALEGDRG